MSLVCSQRATAPPSSIENKAESVQMRTELWSPHHAATAASASACSLQGKGDLELPFPNITESRVNSLAAWAAPTFGLTSSDQHFEIWWSVKGKNKVPRKMRLLQSSPASANRADCTDSTWWCIWFVSFPPPWDSHTRKTKLNIFSSKFRSNSLLFLAKTHSGKESKRRPCCSLPFQRPWCFCWTSNTSPTKDRKEK